LIQALAATVLMIVGCCAGFAGRNQCADSINVIDIEGAEIKDPHQRKH
jgi:hypothetical protein